MRYASPELDGTPAFIERLIGANRVLTTLDSLEPMYDARAVLSAVKEAASVLEQLLVLQENLLLTKQESATLRNVIDHLQRSLRFFRRRVQVRGQPQG